MANNIIRRVWNQNRMVNIEDLYGAAFQAESGGHTFEISGIDDTGAAVTLSGTVSGVFRRPDNADIALTGSASDGVVSVTLSEDCYAVPGRFGLTIFVTSNSQKVAVYACVGTVAVSSTGNVAGDTPANVEDLIDDINAAIADLNTAIGSIPADYSQFMAAIAPAYSSSALYAVGSYAWYNSQLYRCITAITTAESWTAAHWTAAVLGDDVNDLKSAIAQINDAVGVDLSVRKENTVMSVRSTYVPILTGLTLEANTSYRITWTLSEAVTAGDTYIYLRDADGNNMFLNTAFPAGQTSTYRTVTPTEKKENCTVYYYNSQAQMVGCTAVFDKTSYDTENNISTLQNEMETAQSDIASCKSDITDIKNAISTKTLEDITDQIEWEIDGYYINGVIGTTPTGTNSAKTSIIDVEAGEKYSVSGRSNYNQRLLTVYDASNNILLQRANTNIDTTFSYEEITIPEGGTKIGVSYYDSSALSIFKLFKVNTSVVSPESNPLYGKKVAFDGDSICNGSSAGDGKSGWAGRIGVANSMTWHNYGVNGATITAGTTYSGGGNRHWISRYIDTIHQNNPELDYLILEGGTNDADLLKNDPSKWGAITAGYTDTYDDETFYGAVESLFSKALNYWSKVKIGFIIDMKMGYEGTTIGYADNNPRYQFFKKIMDVCDKWGVPYINLWDGCPMCPKIPSQYDNTKTASQNIEAGSLYTDGQHLAPNGYDVVTAKIEAWMKTL